MIRGVGAGGVVLFFGISLLSFSLSHPGFLLPDSQLYFTVSLDSIFQNIV